MPSKVAILNNKIVDFEEDRQAFQARVDGGAMPGFEASAGALADAGWRCERAGAAAADVCLAGIASAAEARAWRDRFAAGEPAIEDGLLLRVDSLRAAFELEAILHELRAWVTVLYASHDGFLAGYVETFQRFAAFVLPDRADLTADTHCLRAFSRLVADTAERRGAGFAGDAAPPAEYDSGRVEAADLWLAPRGRITEHGIRQNLGVALGWLDAGQEFRELPERADAGRLALAQLWQWVRHETGVLDVGRIVTAELVCGLLAEEAAKLSASPAAVGRLEAIVTGESITMHAFCDGPA